MSHPSHEKGVVVHSYGILGRGRDSAANYYGVYIVEEPLTFSDAMMPFVDTSTSFSEARRLNKVLTTPSPTPSLAPRAASSHQAPRRYFERPKYLCLAVPGRPSGTRLLRDASQKALEAHPSLFWFLRA